MSAPEADRAALAREAARADLARFLAACYYEPGPEFTEEGLFTSMAAAAEVVDADLAVLARELGAAFAASDLQALQVDHAQLFLGPGRASAQPYASVWLSGQPQLMQDSTLALLALYAEAGFEVDAGFQDLPDHVAVELEFLYLLLHQATVARMQGDAAAQACSRALLQRFLHQHLGPWIGLFLAALRGAAQTPFYGLLAGATERLVGLVSAADAAR